MDFSILYCLSQVLVILEYFFLTVTYQLSNRKKVLLYSIMSQLAALLAYICLNAWTGMAMSMVAILRNLLFMFNEKKNGIIYRTTKNDIYMLIVIYGITITLTIFTYDGFLSLMSVLATMLYTYSLCQKNNQVYRWLAIPVSIMFVIYNIYIESLFGILLEGVLMLSAISGLMRENMGKMNLKEIYGRK